MQVLASGRTDRPYDLKFIRINIKLQHRQNLTRVLQRVYA